MGRGVWIRFGVQSVLLAGILLVLAGILLDKQKTQIGAVALPAGENGELRSARNAVAAYDASLTGLMARCEQIAGTVSLPQSTYEAARDILAECNNIKAESDIIQENLMNINTPGYRRVISARGSNGRPTDVVRSSRHGRTEHTGIWSDVMPTDDTSFLAVTMADGTRGYTRCGTLRLNCIGELRTPDGLALNPPITGIPTGVTDPNISQNGQVHYTDENGEVQMVGQIALYNFINPSGLSYNRYNGYFRETDSSGSANMMHPGDAGAGDLMSGVVEGSNVNIPEEIAAMSRLTQQLSALRVRLDMAGR